MYRRLQHREECKSPIKVGVVGLGLMGRGILRQLRLTPGIAVEWVANRTIEKARLAAALVESCEFGDSPEALLESHPVDVFIESTNSIESGLRYCEAAIQSGAHVILMNAEVDLAFGPYLGHLAKKHGVVVSSCAGDQHGVLAMMIDEISVWGFEVVQAGNVKGFLQRNATTDSLKDEAAKRNLSPVLCCALTDGTKLNIEMALVSNAYGYLPTKAGMEGPRAHLIDEAVNLFDFENYPEQGVIDYILGDEPGGGVYVIAKCDSAEQARYLEYYKMLKSDQGPYYLFYRPYHLCHVEIVTALYKAVEHKEALLLPWKGRVSEVYAYAKADFPANTEIKEAIGSDIVYGMVKQCSDAVEQVPVVTLAAEGAKPVLKRSVVKDQALTYHDIHWPDRRLLDRYLQPLNHQTF